MKTAIVIQCRYDSSRLLGKILFELEPNLTVLEYMIKRLQTLNRPIIVATTLRDADKPIRDKVLSLAIHYPDLQLYQGSYTNVARRLYEATDGYDYFFRITGDDIFTELESLEKNIYKVEIGELVCDYGFTANMIRGFDYELFNRDALLDVIQKFKNEQSIEHLEHYFETSKRIHLEYSEYYNGKFKGISLSLDTQKDWELIKIIYSQISHFKPKYINLFIIEYINSNKHLTNINKTPLVSVYMVTKNCFPTWLTEAVNGILGQTYKDFEFVIVDYGTRDIYNLKPIFDKLADHHIKFYKIDILNDVSFIDAVKYAISKCTGKYIIRADADDILYSTAIEKMLKVALEVNASMVMSDYDSTNNENELESSFLPCQALIERKKYEYVKYVKNQTFRDGVNLKQAFQKYGFLIKKINEPLFFHRTHVESLTHKIPIQELKILDEDIIKEINNVSI